ncbi:MAG TPA: apolipoprotein N-acyltransferase [Tepidisphaeraceae bacterium]|nr:apolipoprotein N-acyltransferase [Tepidisphaeraceae bacterium]
MRTRSRRSQQFRRANGAPAPAAAPVIRPWYDGAWLPMLSAVLLTLAFAPIGQFYLAWIALLPFLLFIRRAATRRRLFLWTWAGGIAFFALNIWWLGFVTVPGTIASVAYMGLYWGLAAVITRAAWGDGGGGTREDQGWRVEGGEGGRNPSSAVYLLPSTLSPFTVAAIWTGCEWVRGNLGTGWPWSFIGYTQTPLLAMCQVADMVGVYGVTFWVVAVNVLVALLVTERFRLRPLLWPVVGVAVMLLLVLGYGIVRMEQTRIVPGPRVMVVQSNFPQSNTGDKGADQDELIDFHVNTTRDALEAERAAGREVDLVAWSETMMPALNKSAREFTHGSALGMFLQDTYQRLASLCFNYTTALITGGAYAGRMESRNGRYIDLDRRNAAYFFEPTGVMSDLRYDKVHLVPFGEYVPFKETIPPLYRFFMWFSPYEFDYNLVPGGDDQLTVFALERGMVRQSATAPLTQREASGADIAPAASTQPASGPFLSLPPPARFVVPICFEDADPRLVARMFDGQGAKRADFIVNITNDGWFSQPQLSQHLQIARFRSIENRVPTARSVNTGISAFIDSLGRVYQRLAAHEAGTLTSILPLDPRLTLYTRIGDAFAIACTAFTAMAAAWAFVRARRAKPAATAGKG